ncbi:iron donor protein CyaY [Buchnera aphidicola (Kurisakia onigurumii)]|uniref:iron donor protein CyaY n=1 Tax=Buchnera aphidicola TaxID=9 RepID=UPI0031B66E82
MNNTCVIKKNNFNKLFLEITLKIEKIIDDYSGNKNLDYEMNQNIFTIFINEKKIIINKQEYLQQIWMATTKQGYHFALKKKKWICIRNNINIWVLLKKIFKKELQEDIITI